MYMYIDIYIYVYIHAYTCVYIYIKREKYTYIHTCIHTYIHVYIYARMTFREEEGQIDWLMNRSPHVFHIPLQTPTKPLHTYPYLPTHALTYLCIALPLHVLFSHKVGVSVPWSLQRESKCDQGDTDTEKKDDDNARVQKRNSESVRAQRDITYAMAQWPHLME